MRSWTPEARGRRALPSEQPCLLCSEFLFGQLPLVTQFDQLGKFVGHRGSLIGLSIRQGFGCFSRAFRSVELTHTLFFDPGNEAKDVDPLIFLTTDQKLTPDSHGVEGYRKMPRRG